MITLLKSKMDTLLRDRGVHVIPSKHVQKFKFSLLALCACLYISIFAATSEMPIGEMNIEKKNIRSTEYFDRIPVAKESAYGIFIGKEEDVVVVPVGE